MNRPEINPVLTSVLPPIGTSDHSTIEFQIKVSSGPSRIYEAKDFAKANFKAIGDYLSDIDWIGSFGTVDSVMISRHRSLAIRLVHPLQERLSHSENLKSSRDFCIILNVKPVLIEAMMMFPENIPESWGGNFYNKNVTAKLAEKKDGRKKGGSSSTRPRKPNSKEKNMSQEHQGGPKDAQMKKTSAEQEQRVDYGVRGKKMNQCDKAGKVLSKEGMVKQESHEKLDEAGGMKKNEKEDKKNEEQRHGQKVGEGKKGSGEETMCSIAAAFAMLLHLSQITPALFCTFRQLPPSAEIKVPTYPPSSPFFKDHIEDCMKMCYEDPSCVYVISFKNGYCSSNPSEGESMRASEVWYDQDIGGVVYQLDRNETVMMCPRTSFGAIRLVSVSASRGKERSYCLQLTRWMTHFIYVPILLTELPSIEE
ncbi:hypothetical protein OSTOST_14008, partial [Ostertagia ostertagi]